MSIDFCIALAFRKKVGEAWSLSAIYALPTARVISFSFILRGQDHLFDMEIVPKAQMYITPPFS
jgi:hypothetical protein